MSCAQPNRKFGHSSLRTVDAHHLRTLELGNHRPFKMHFQNSHSYPLHTEMAAILFDVIMKVDQIRWILLRRPPADFRLRPKQNNIFVKLCNLLELRSINNAILSTNEMCLPKHPSYWLWVEIHVCDRQPRKCVTEMKAADRNFPFIVSDYSFLFLQCWHASWNTTDLTAFLQASLSFYWLSMDEMKIHPIYSLCFNSRWVRKSKSNLLIKCKLYTFWLAILTVP